MDKAADYGSEDFTFKFWQGRNILSHTKIYFILNIYCHYCLPLNSLPCGPMDKASDYESGDSRFESRQGRNIFSHAKIYFILNICCHYCLHQSRCVVAQRIRQLTSNQEIPGSSPGNVVIFCLILRSTLYLIFTVINAYRKLVALRRNG